MQNKPKSMRNPNGFGTVYKLPGRRRRPWVARVTAGWELVGEKAVQKYYTVGYYKTKKEGIDALVLYRAGAITPRPETTLAEIYTEWSAGKFKNISPATVQSYSGAWEYVKQFADKRIGDLRTAHWQEVIDSIARQGLSHSLAGKAKALMSMLNRYALKNDVVSKDYSSFIEMPRFPQATKERFSDLEVKKIADAAAAGVPWADTVLILIYTGFRISEFLSLTKFSVDMDKLLVVGGAKTEAGRNRTIPIHPKIAGYVRARLDENGDRLISRNGKKINKDYYRKRCYYPALEAAGVRKLSPHTCRHTFCSRLAEAGADPLYIKELAGHSAYAFTADKYTHPQEKELQNAIKLMT